MTVVTPLLSLRAYARRRGVTLEAVRKAIARGRLHASLERRGRSVKIADPELADREWKANTDLSRATPKQLLAASDVGRLRGPSLSSFDVDARDGMVQISYSDPKFSDDDSPYSDDDESFCIALDRPTAQQFGELLIAAAKVRR